MNVAEPAVIESRQLKTLLEEDFYLRTFPIVERFVRKMNGSGQDAKDIFHDALLIYYEKSGTGLLKVREDPEAYVLGIAKHLWIRRFHADRRLVSLSEAEERIRIPDNFFPSVSSTRLMLFLEKAGKRCLDLLHAVYFQNRRLRELDYAHEHSASVQKYKCIERLRQLIKDKHTTYEDFTD